MPLSRAVELRADSEIPLLLGISPAPRYGIITGTSGAQYTVNVADDDAQDVLAWPLNGFEYATNDVVVLSFIANQGDSAIIIGSYAPIPRLGIGIVDHGGLLGNGDDDHTQYLLLLGRAGGQTFYGGTGSGDDLTISSTSHATKGHIAIAPGAESVAIGHSSPFSGSALHVQGANNPVLLMERAVAGLTTSILAALSVRATTTGDMGNGFGAAIDGHINDSAVSGSNPIARIAFVRANSDDDTGDMLFLPANNGSLTERLRIQYNGRLGHGVSAPSLWEYSHDGTSGRCFGTVNITDGTAQTIIANAAGDVTDILFYEVIINPSTGSSLYLSGNTTPTGTTITLFDSGGTETCVLHCNANGSVDIQRTAGTRTYTCTVRLLWQ